MAYHHVDNNLLIGGTGFITRNPTSIDKLETPLVYKVPHIILNGLVLNIPPSFEVVNLCLGELTGRVSEKSLNNCCENRVDLLVEVLFRGF